MLRSQTVLRFTPTEIEDASLLGLDLWAVKTEEEFSSAVVELVERWSGKNRNCWSKFPRHSPKSRAQAPCARHCRQVKRCATAHGSIFRRAADR